MDTVTLPFVEYDSSALVAVVFGAKRNKSPYAVNWKLDDTSKAGSVMVKGLEDGRKELVGSHGHLC